MLEEFRDMVGEKHYESFMALLKEIGPDCRTTRISVVIAGFLRFALKRTGEDLEEGGLAETLAIADGARDLESEECGTLSELIGRICEEAGMRNHRVSAGGIGYTIAEHTVSEYVEWYSLPWEG